MAIAMKRKRIKKWITKEEKKEVNLGKRSTNSSYLESLELKFKMLWNFLIKKEKIREIDS